MPGKPTYQAGIQVRQHPGDPGAGVAKSASFFVWLGRKSKASHPGLVFQRAANHLTKARKTVWLLQDRRALFHQRNQGCCLGRVPGREDHANSGSQSAHLQIGFRTIQRRHHDIHNNQIDVIGIRLEELQSFPAIGRDNRAIAEPLQHFLCRIPEPS